MTLKKKVFLFLLFLKKNEIVLKIQVQKKMELLKLLKYENWNEKQTLYSLCLVSKYYQSIFQPLLVNTCIWCISTLPLKYYPIVKDVYIDDIKLINENLKAPNIYFSANCLNKKLRGKPKMSAAYYDWIKFPDSVQKLYLEYKFRQPFPNNYQFPISLIKLKSYERWQNPPLLPLNLKSLYLFDWNDSLNKLHLPQSLTSLHLYYFNEPINNQLPENLTKLTLNIFNKVIEFNDLPNTLKKLRLPMFCQTLNFLPQSLTYLEIKNLNFSTKILPISLTFLNFCNFISNEYDLSHLKNLKTLDVFQLQQKMKFPENLITLNVSEIREEHSFLCPEFFPLNLQILKIAHFSSTNLKIFPQCLHTLIINEFPIFLKNLSFPQSLKVLCISPHRDVSIIFPSQLEKLKILGHFNQDLNNLPITLKKLTLDSLFNFEKFNINSTFIIPVLKVYQRSVKKIPSNVRIFKSINQYIIQDTKRIKIH